MTEPAIVPSRHAVTSFDGTVIAFDFYDNGSSSIALIVPGFWRHRSHPALRRFALLAADLGRSACVVDLRGHGGSGGTFGFNRHEHHDVAAVAAELVAMRPGARLDVAGFSLGGAISVTTMARHDELPWRSLLLISAVAEFGSIAPRPNPLTAHRHLALSQLAHTPRFDWRFRRSEKHRAVDDIAAVRVPVCLIHIENDWLIAHSHSERLYAAAAEPKQLHILKKEGRYHADRIFAVAAPEAEAIVADFWRKVGE